MLGSKIFYCGGLQSDYERVNSCHSYDLGSEIGEGWQEEPRMVEVRALFGLNAVADGLIATGGYTKGQVFSSVEVFSIKDGWKTWGIASDWANSIYEGYSTNYQYSATYI